MVCTNTKLDPILSLWKNTILEVNSGDPSEVLAGVPQETYLNAMTH